MMVFCTLADHILLNDNEKKCAEQRISLVSHLERCLVANKVRILFSSIYNVEIEPVSYAAV